MVVECIVAQSDEKETTSLRVVGCVEIKRDGNERFDARHHDRLTHRAALVTCSGNGDIVHGK